MLPPPARSPLFPYTTLFRSEEIGVGPLAAVLEEAAVFGRGCLVTGGAGHLFRGAERTQVVDAAHTVGTVRSEEHTSELQSQFHLVCRLLLEKKKIQLYSVCH